jgi:outer membrane protein TolC
MTHRGRVCGQIRTGAILCFTVASACATATERSTRSDLRSVEADLAPLPPTIEASGPGSETPAFDGTLGAYLAHAYARSPSLRATFEDWRAATHRPRQERRLPEPTITYAAFIRSVETRVGPQRHRLGAMQWFPWPTKLTAGGQAASLEAQAGQRRFEGHALEIAAAVSSAYWELWRVQRRREVLEDEVEILGSLSEQIRVRVEVGGAELADLAQVDLMVSRARDRLAGLDETEKVASARLVQVVGAPDGTATPVSRREPVVAEVSEPIETLTAEASGHPRVETLATLSDAAGERVREARADRAPSVGVGVDWIITGESAATPAPPDSGKDAVALALALKVPLWARAYKAGEEEARARSAAMRARAIDARNAVAAEVRQQAARVSDDVRRVRVHETTLVPQAETAFESVLNSYATGRSTVAELLLVERELIGLQDELFAAQADYGTHIAQLESAVGRAVQTKGRVDADR